MLPQLEIQLKEGKKLYFASDFHLGTPTPEASFEREKHLVSWLQTIEKDAQALFLVGDIFDFWFEYPHVVPKGFVRFLGKLAHLSDSGIPIYLFTGNHDMWMFDYLEKEINAKIIRENVLLTVNDKKIYLGHGDGLGPGDATYKFLKKFFASRICQWMFRWLHPSVGFGIAQSWSKHSRAANVMYDEKYFGDQEWLFQYAQEQLKTHPADYYIFGHRHLPMVRRLGESSIFLNLGDWLSYNTFATFDQSLQFWQFQHGSILPYSPKYGGNCLN